MVMLSVADLVDRINAFMHAQFSTIGHAHRPLPVPSMATIVQNIRHLMTVTTLGQIREPAESVCAWSPLGQRSIELMCDHDLMVDCYNGVHMADIDGAQGELPVCSYMHDVGQMTFGRTSRNGTPAPVCCNSATHTCCVDSLPCPNVDTLHDLYAKAQVFLTPEQQAVFEATGQAKQGPCLMCLRRDIAKLVYQLQGTHTPENLSHMPKIVLPFTNQHGCHGGYRSDALLHTSLTIGNIVEFSNDFKVWTVPVWPPQPTHVSS